MNENEYEERWQELQRAMCLVSGHDWKSYDGGVRCTRCRVYGAVEVTQSRRCDQPSDPSS